MTFDQVKDRTSSAMGMSGDGALFDEMIAAYSLRRKTAHEFIVSTLNNAHSKSFRTYSQRAQFTTIGDALAVEDLSLLNVSPELDEPLHILTRNLAFLAKPLSAASFRRVWREALGKLQDQLINDVLLRQEFTTHGAAQYLRDVAELLDAVNRYIPGGSSALATLQDGVRLLNLPVASEDDKAITLKAASDRVFTNNGEARKLLEELELGELTPQLARNILQRRIENGENVE
jgi:RAD50-interacting protein 1